MRVVARLITLLTVLIGAVVAPAMLAEAVTRPETLYHERPVSAGPVTPGFPIDHVGVVFDLDETRRHDVHELASGPAVRFRHAGRWGGWIELEEDGAQAAGTWSSALVDGGDAEAYQVRGLPAFGRTARAAALNTTDGPRVEVGHRSRGEARAVSSCRSRADWGADESIRRGSRSFAPIQILTVHHTATKNNDRDPDARVRAIYSYHVKTNGWDDIGYQALISEAGTVYEGRWSGSTSLSCLTQGGTGRDFAHRTADDASDIVTGAHAAGYNTGNLGVALLGTFTDVAPRAAARASLVEYLAELAHRHGMDAQGTVAYDNGTNAKVVPSIVGHRDLVATDCPGGVLYADLPALRTDVAAATTDPTSPDEPTPSEEPTSPTDPAATPTGETTTFGTVSGTYAALATTDGTTQSLTEVETGGKPSNRTSRLQHTWYVPVGTGPTTLTVDVTGSTSSDGDRFAFAYSTDGTSFTRVILMPASGSGTFTAALPATTAGTVHIRLTDTDRTKGRRALDTIRVDRVAVTPS